MIILFSDPYGRQKYIEKGHLANHIICSLHFFPWSSCGILIIEVRGWVGGWVGWVATAIIDAQTVLYYISLEILTKNKILIRLCLIKKRSLIKPQIFVLHSNWEAHLVHICLALSSNTWTHNITTRTRNLRGS